MSISPHPGPPERDDTFPGLEAAPEPDEAPRERLPDDPRPEVESGFRIDQALQPVALVYSSSKAAGRPHVVTVLDLARGDELVCTCRTVRSLMRRPEGCRHMVRTRELLGMPQPGGSDGDAG